MIIRKTLLKVTAISTVVLSLAGCDHDQEPIGSEIIGEPGFNAGLYEEAQINAYNNDLEAVQTNNLPVNLLGVYDHEFYGTQTAHLLTQLSLSAANPDFGVEPVLDSVVLSIPYFSTEGETDADGRTDYELDSIYGSTPIKLSIYESNYFLNQYDSLTDFETAQAYYSDLDEQLEGNISSDPFFEIENFIPSDLGVIEFPVNAQGEQDTVRLAPQLRLELPVEFFEDKILDKEGSMELSSSNNFRNYFRGIYIKAATMHGDGSMMLLNLMHEDAGITLYYTSKGEDPENGISGSYELGFGPSKVNIFEQEQPEYGNENLYLKGGEGSMAIIELFSGPDSDGDGASDELENLRENEWLVNEANLVFHVNQERLSTDAEPQHLYLYNLEDNMLLADYVLDSQGGENQMSSVTNYNHLVPLERDEEGNGISYKIRITRHLDNILNNEAANVKLGLVVSQNINEVSNSAVRTSENNEVERVPVSSVITPLGTILYGTGAADVEKRPELNIYYTEPIE